MHQAVLQLTRIPFVKVGTVIPAQAQNPQTPCFAHLAPFLVIYLLLRNLFGQCPHGL